MSFHERLNDSQKSKSQISSNQESNNKSVAQRGRMHPQSMTHADIKVLQRTIGNQAVGKIMREMLNDKSKPIQQEDSHEVEDVLQGKFNEVEVDAISKDEEEPVQMKNENKTGLPDNLKDGIENLSGISMDDVRVHFNSEKPGQLLSYAFAQGSEIFLALGQEKHLPHEAWHVIQQKQGRVKQTHQMKNGEKINDENGLEKEADMMGTKALHTNANTKKPLSNGNTNIGNVNQRVVYNNEADLWAAVEPDTPLEEIRNIINGNAELRNAYEDSLLNLQRMNFIQDQGTQPEASYAQNDNETYNITYGLRAGLQGTYSEKDKFIGAIIHEMGHVNSGLQYNTNIPHGEVYHIANMHLPVAANPMFPGTMVGKNQCEDPIQGWEAQNNTMRTNWNVLTNLRIGSKEFTSSESDYLEGREQYAMGVAPEAHYDTVLSDILFFLQYNDLKDTQYYLQATAMLKEANLRRRAGEGVVKPVKNDFLQLFTAVSDLLKDNRWENEGKKLIGSKTPDGIMAMRNTLNTIKDKREALNRIQEIASEKNGEDKKNRSKTTREAYELLSMVNQRDNLSKLIARVKLFQMWLGVDNNQGMELQDL